ncbi:MAG: AAA family ATPase [Fibrobacter sp.]|nr:AAA family ATPase [Fibrobacter sp.]
MSGIEEKLALRPEDTQPVIDFNKLDFETTDELRPLEEIVGQPRAVKALELGLGIRNSGYNIYMSGISGMGRKSLVRDILKRKAESESTPSDWIFVNNFTQEDRPIAIKLSPGKGKELRREMDILIERLKDDIPRAFRQEDFSREKQRLNQHYEKQGREAFSRVEQLAQQKNLILKETPDGRILMIPKKDDHQMSNEEFETLSSAQKEEISRNQQEVGQAINAIFNEQSEIGINLREDVKKIERDFASKLIDPAIDKILSKYKNDKLELWFSQVRENMKENLGRFREKESGQQQMLASMLGGAVPEEKFLEYRINVVVDNSELKGAPVIFEESPNYKNIFGTIAGTVDRSGKLFTSFNNIKAGSILRANGGYLIFNIMDALSEPLVWKELKRSLKSRELEYHMYDPFGVFSAFSLRPEPIPLDIKIVVIGSPLIYHLLQIYDEDFQNLFKVKAEFAPELSQSENTGLVIARFVKKLKDNNNLLPFDKNAIAELLKAGARLAGDKSKITAELSRLSDIIHESSFWAKKDSSSIVKDFHVHKAVKEKIYRSDLIAEKMREYISNGTLLINVKGTSIGQVNGLSIVQLGDYSFGRASRISASAGIGNSGLINIERESRLSGSNFDKAMLILEGFFRNKYASKHPVALSASIAMEQSYGLIEGDSATLAELLCLLSSFAEVPLRQDIAVTGSVNQHGQVQAVGGVTQKVEGFFDVCKHIGLTSEQGCCIPASNVRNLILRQEIVDAVKSKMFHVWAVNSVDEALELLSGLSAGNTDETGSFHWKVDQRLISMLNIIKRQKALSFEHEYPAYSSSPNSSRDPRPRFPGDQDCT